MGREHETTISIILIDYPGWFAIRRVSILWFLTAFGTPRMKIRLDLSSFFKGFLKVFQLSGEDSRLKAAFY